MQKKDKTYIPAMRFDFLTPLYDPLIKIFMPEGLIKNALIEQANIQSGHRVLDFGCGTGTLTLMARVKNPDAVIIGVDIDEKIIKIARKKIADKKLDIAIDIYDGVTLPYEDKSFDKVISSLVFHHLTKEQKEDILKELYRMLKAGGEIHIADFGRPEGKLMKIVSHLLRLFEPIDDNIRGLMPEYLTAAGFLDARENGRYNTVVGTLVIYSAFKP